MAIPMTPGALLVILAITIAISLGAGYAVSKFEERQKPADEKPLQTASAPAAQPTLPDEHIVLKVTIDKSLAWHLELDNARLQVGNLSAEQRARLVNILVQIRPWVDGKPAPAPAPVAPRQTAALPAATPSHTTQPLQPISTEPPKINIGRGFRSLITNDLKNMEKSHPVSIVAMIDDFLQKRLEISPLADRQIRLEEGAIGEVIVLIGKERFTGVDAVPDPQVQAIIRAAISDWEKSA